jgi:hypothetical protein
MWSARCQELANRRVLKMAIELDSAPVSYADVLRRWQDDGGFRSFFISLLADSPYSAFRWETPPVTASTVQGPFELVLLDSPGLASRPDLEAFSEHFEAGAEVVVFPNLSGDATLVVPCPSGPASIYGHLAAFLRGAPESQKHALWARVGEAMEQRVGAVPVWLSTAGAGVSWLHVRLDDRPKYYGYAPYRNTPR